MARDTLFAPGGTGLPGRLPSLLEEADDLQLPPSASSMAVAAQGQKLSLSSWDCGPQAQPVSPLITCVAMAAATAAETAQGSRLSLSCQGRFSLAGSPSPLVAGAPASGSPIDAAAPPPPVSPLAAGLDCLKEE